MEFATEFALAADAGSAWDALLDVPRMAPLMPGAVLEETSDAAHRGRVKIKFGATTITYRGTVRTAVVDDLTRTAILEAAAREARGGGTAEAVFQATVLPSPAGCRVLLHVRASFTGRAAALPDPVVREAATKILARFAASLSAALNTPEPALPEPLNEADGAAPAEAAEREEAPVVAAEPVAEPTEAAEREEAPVVATEPVAVPAALEPREEAAGGAAEPVAVPAAPEPRDGAADVAAERLAEPEEQTGPSGGSTAGPGGAAARAGGLRRVLPVAALLLAVLVVVRAVARRRGD